MFSPSRMPFGVVIFIGGFLLLVWVVNLFLGVGEKVLEWKHVITLSFPFPRQL